jgi:hypothetical protein
MFDIFVLRTCYLMDRLIGAVLFLFSVYQSYIVCGYETKYFRSKSLTYLFYLSLESWRKNSLFGLVIVYRLESKQAAFRPTLIIYSTSYLSSP